MFASVLVVAGCPSGTKSSLFSRNQRPAAASLTRPGWKWSTRGVDDLEVLTVASAMFTVWLELPLRVAWLDFLDAILPIASVM